MRFSVYLFCILLSMSFSSWLHAYLRVLLFWLLLFVMLFGDDDEVIFLFWMIVELMICFWFYFLSEANCYCRVMMVIFSDYYRLRDDSSYACRLLTIDWFILLFDCPYCPFVCCCSIEWRWSDNYCSIAYDLANSCAILLSLLLLSDNYLFNLLV